MSSLLERMGGEATLAVVVDNFYDRMVADDRLRQFFTGVDMDKQRRHQVKFLAFAFGGDSRYDGPSLARSHQRLVQELGLTDVHFDATAENMVAALTAAQVAPNLIDEVLAIAAATRDEVLGRVTAVTP